MAGRVLGMEDALGNEQTGPCQVPWALLWIWASSEIKDCGFMGISPLHWG